MAPTGWLTKVAPSVVLFQPSYEPSVSVWRTGVPEYLTTVVNSPSTGVAGVTMSLCTSVVAFAVVVFSMRLKVAGAPLTVTEVTLSVEAARVVAEPWKSKAYDERGAPVVTALIDAVASGKVVTDGAAEVLEMATSTVRSRS